MCMLHGRKLSELAAILSLLYPMNAAQSAAYHGVSHRYVLFEDLPVGAVRVRKLPRMAGYRGTEGHKRHKDIRGCLIRNTL